MNHKLIFLVFLIGVTSAESSTSVGSSVTSSSTSTDLPTAPILGDGLPWTFKVVTTKTDAPATTLPPFVTSKPGRTLHLVTGGTDTPAASPDSAANQDEVVSVTAIVPAETMRLVTGKSTATPSPSSGSTTIPSVVTPPPTGGPSTAATTPTPISPTKSAISSPSTVSTVNSASTPTPAPIMSTISSSSTVTTSDNVVSGPSSTISSAKSSSTTSTSSGAGSTTGQDDTLDSTATRDHEEISDSTQVTRGDGNFRNVVSSTTLKSSDRTGSTEESVNGATNVSPQVLSTGSDGSAKLDSSSTETSNDNGSEIDAQSNRLDTNTGSRAVTTTALSLLLIILQSVLY